MGYGIYLIITFLLVPSLMRIMFRPFCGDDSFLPFMSKTSPLPLYRVGVRLFSLIDVVCSIKSAFDTIYTSDCEYISSLSRYCFMSNTNSSGRGLYRLQIWPVPCGSAISRAHKFHVVRIYEPAIYTILAFSLSYSA